MCDVLSSAELDGQRMELLPARTVLSMFATAGTESGNVVGSGGGVAKNVVDFVLHGNATGVPGDNANGSSATTGSS